MFMQQILAKYATVPQMDSNIDCGPSFKDKYSLLYRAHVMALLCNYLCEMEYFLLGISSNAPDKKGSQG